MAFRKRLPDSACNCNTEGPCGGTAEGDGAASVFDEIVSATEVKLGKPAPDVYIKTLEVLGADPEECLAVEDSPNGVESATAAGIPTVMIPDQTQPDEVLQKKLYACLPALGELVHLLQ